MTSTDCNHYNILFFFFIFITIIPNVPKIVTQVAPNLFQVQDLHVYVVHGV